MEQKLGISSQLDNSEWQVYIDKLKTGDYQIGRMGWVADFKDPYTFLEMFDTAKNGNNQTGWENAQYKDLLKKQLLK